MESTGVYGLAYTLSGGFRVIASRATGIGVADLSGMGVTTSGGPIAEGILTAVGALPTSENAGAAETTYTRFAALEGAGNMRTIIETGHSLFLTAVVADASFYGTLSAEDKAALYLAARAAALVEREDSILLAEEVRTELESKGVTIITPSAEEKQALIEQTAPVYAQFEALFAPGLVQSLSGK